MSRAQLNEKSMMDPATKAKVEEEIRQKKFAARDEDNEYQGAIRMTISILQQYDQDQHIPVLGFGAKLPPFYNACSACFAINGNIFHPDCHKVKGIISAYNKNI